MITRTGQERIEAAFRQAGAQQRCALMPYLMMGYPDLPMTCEIVSAIASAGADIVELGVPFSDPIADGSIIQQAAYTALQQGVTPARCLETAARLRAAGVSIPFLFMGYYNPIFVWGTARYTHTCKEAGVDGLIVPDLPIEEATDLLAACQAEGLALVFLVAPNTPDSRLAAIASQARGFVYLVSRPGITGTRDSLPDGLAGYVARVRRHTNLPLGLGFGISTPAHVRQVAGLVDGVVIGSAVVERAQQGAAAVASFVAELRQATFVSKTLS